jgi:ABC-type branched-subunit amino acid transport system substrate-binding protein
MTEPISCIDILLEKEYNNTNKKYYKTLDKIFDNIEEIVISVNQHNEIINLNLAAEKGLDINKASIIGVDIQKLIFDLKLENYKIIQEDDIKIYIIKKNMDSIEQYQNNLSDKECFLFNVSHEIRTPLNGIIGITQILKNKVDSNLQEYIDIISTCGYQLMDILNDILDYAKISSGHVDMNITSFNLSNCIEEIYDIIIARANINKPNVDITYFIDSNIPEEIFTDRKRLKQILLNLLSNSIKFTESGYKYAFRIFPDARQQTDSLATNAAKRMNAKNAILLNEKTNAGIDIADTFEKTFSANGGKILGRLEFARDVNDFTAIATKVASMGNVDVLLISALEGQTVKLFQALAQAGVTKGGGGKAIPIATIWVPWGFDQKAGKAAVGYTRISQFDPNETRPVVQNFVKAFKAKYGADTVPTHINAHAYDQILIIAEAVRKGATNSESIRNEFLKMKDVEVTTGKITFGPNGQNQNMSVIHYVETNPDLSWKTLNW